MKHSHYFKPVPAGVTHVDVYRVLQMFDVTCPALQHAAKKILVAGGRGAKDTRKDVQEAIDTLQRKLAMLDEDATESMVMEVTGTADPTKCCGQPHDCSQVWCARRSHEMAEQKEGWVSTLGMTHDDVISLDSRRVQLRDVTGVIYQGPADALRWSGITHYRLLP